jgi:diaminohydroxyphosphoribosylaminopyrimidine deaminase / 5-amino-6-(5-phosphoribosylamino)uracil reductase
MVTPELREGELHHLTRALELARRGRGRVSPNPLVGAVLERGGRVIGEGFHVELGGLHAERAALADCASRDEDPRSSTMFVTLEPCAHHGRQPPCTDAIVESGVSRVVIASEDPTEKAAGRGPGILRDAGVDVVWADGEVATAARLLNQPFRKHSRTGRPHVVLKMAQSLDGRVATAQGDSKWISSEASRELVHEWRGESDAIAAGIGTALADDPLLTARGDNPPRKPTRVIFDSAARLPLHSRLLQTVVEAPVVVVCSRAAEAGRMRLLEEAGAEILLVDGVRPAERVIAALDALGRRQLTSLFLEGGPTLAAAFLEAGEIDEARVFVAPILIGAGPSAVEGAGVAAIADAARAVSVTSPQVGDDVLICARMREW